MFFFFFSSAIPSDPTVFMPFPSDLPRPHLANNPAVNMSARSRPFSNTDSDVVPT